MNQLYVVYDRVAEESWPVFEQRTDAAALRAFGMAIVQQKASAEDFQLLRVGCIDHHTNVLVVASPPVEVIASVGEMEEDDE